MSRTIWSERLYNENETCLKLPEGFECAPYFGDHMCIQFIVTKKMIITNVHHVWEDKTYPLFL